MNRAERRRREKEARKKGAPRENLTAVAIELEQSGLTGDAIEAYRAALEAEPDHIDNRFSLARLLAASGDIEAAIEAYWGVIERTPKNVPALTNLGNLYAQRMRFAEAIEIQQRAAEIAPTEATVLLNLGLAHRWNDQPQAAAEVFHRALELNADNVDALSLLGSAHMEMGEASAALEYYDRVAALKPDVPAAQSFRAGPLLILQEFEAGYRAQAFADAGLGVEPPVAQPEWRGEDLSGKSILVWAEEGVGDEILFAACLDDLAAQATSCTLVSDARLVALLARSFPGLAVVAKGAALEGAFDFQIGMSALPRRLRNDLASFPKHDGYLKPDPEQQAAWRDKVQALGPGKKVGLFWRSGLVTVERQREYPPLADWAPLLALPGVEFVSLQYGEPQDDLQGIAPDLAARVHVFDDLDLFDDLEGSAALISTLDLVITPQAATAWMAAALGVPTWVLNRPGDWRQFGTDGFPWLPTVRLLTKPAGTRWAETMQRVATELESELSG